MHRTRKRRGCLRAFVVILILLALAAALFIGVRRGEEHLVTEEYELYFPTLPESFDGLRIAQLSDLHGKEFGEGNGRLLEHVRSLAPDLVVITGDLIDSPGQLTMVETLLRGLTAIAPTFYVTGNHDWTAGELSELLELMASLGVTALENRYTELSIDGESIVLAGFTDPNGPYDMETPPELVARLRLEHPESFVLGLYHRNGWLRAYSDVDVQLVLSGHAHGGVVRLPFTDGLIGPNREWLPRYTAGVYREGGATLVVSRGLGGIKGIPVPRLLNDPDVPLIILRSGAEPGQ